MRPSNQNANTYRKPQKSTNELADLPHADTLAAPLPKPKGTGPQSDINPALGNRSTKKTKPTEPTKDTKKAPAKPQPKAPVQQTSLR